MFARFYLSNAIADYLNLFGKTRARRYANHKGGRKFAAGETAKVEADEREGIMGGRRKRQKVEEPDEGKGWEGKKEKEEARLVFREFWG